MKYMTIIKRIRPEAIVEDVFIWAMEPKRIVNLAFCYLRFRNISYLLALKANSINRLFAVTRTQDETVCNY